MIQELIVNLDCCHSDERVSVDVSRITAREPNELKKNIICPGCGKLVILSFEQTGNRTSVSQEVIDLGKGR